MAISGELTSDDYDKARPELELSAIKDDLMFTKDFNDSIDKMAVVTDESS